MTTLAHGLAASAAAAAAAGTPATSSLCQICKQGAAKVGGRTLWPVQLTCGVCEQTGTWHVSCLLEQRALLSPADRAALCPYHVSANCTCHDAPASSGDCERCFRRWCHADPFPAPDTALSMLREDTPPATPRDMSDTSSSTSASTSTPTSTSSRPAHATTSPLLGSSSASVAHDPLMFGPSSVVMLGDAFMHGERSAVTTPSRSRPVSVHEGPSPARFYDTSVGMLTSPAQGHSTSSMSAHSLDMMTMSSRSTPDMSHVVADLHDAPSLQISGAAPISVGNEGLLMSEVEPLAPAISSLHADETSSPFRFGAATAIMPLHLRDDDAMERVILPAARMVKLDSSGSPSEEDTDVPMLISPFMTGKPSAKSKADHHASPRRKRSKSRSASRSSSVGASSRCPPLPVGDAKGSMKLRLLKYGAKAPPAKGSKKKKKGKTTRRKTKKSRRKPKPVKIAPDATAAEILAALLPSGVADAAEPYIIVSAEPSPHDHLVDLEYPLFPLTRSKAKRETMAQNPRAQIKTRAAFSFLDKGELTEQEAEWAVWANEGVRCSASSKGVLTSVSRNLPLLHNGTSNSISLDGAAPQPPQPVTAPSSQVIVKASPSATRNGRESRSFAGLCLYLEPRALYDPTFLAKVTASPVSATAAKSRKPPASSASAPARGRRSGTSNSAYYNYSSSYRGPSSIPMPPPPLAQTLPPSSAAAKAAASARLSAPPEEYVPPLKPPPTLAEQQAELRRRAAAAAAAGPPPSGYYYRGQYYPYSSAGPGQRCKCAECIRLYGPEGAPASSSYVRYSSYRTPDGRIVYTPYNSSSPYYAGKPGSPPSGAPVKREGGARYPSQQAPSSSASASSSSSSRRPPATKPTKGSTARKSSAASASRSRAPTPTPPPLRKTFLAGRSSDTVSSALVPAGSKSPSKRALPHLILVLTWQMRCVFVELPVEMQAMAQRELAHGAVVWIKGAVADAPPVTLRDPRLPPSATGRQQVFGCGALEVHLQQGLSSKTTFPCIRPVHASSIAFVRPNTRLARAFLAFTHDELLRLNAPPGEKKKRKKRKRSVTTTVTPPPAAVSLSSDDLPDEHTPLIRMSTAAKRSSARRDSDSISLRGLPDRASKRLRIVMPRAVEENDGDSDVEMVSESLPSGRGSGRGRAKNNVNDQDHGDVMMAPDDVSVRRSGRRRRPSQRAAATRTSMDGSSSRSRGQRGTGSGSEIVVNVSTHLHHHHHHHHHGTTTSTNALSSMSVPPELLRGLNSSVLGGDDALPSLDPLAMGLDGIDTLGSLGPLSLGALVDPIDMDDEGFEHLSASPETPLDDIDSFMMDGDDDVTKPQTLASLAQSPPTDADESVSLLHHPTPDDDADADGARARKRPRKSPTTSTTSKAAKAAKAAKTAHYIHHHLHHHHHHHPSSKLGGGNIQWVVCDSPSCRKWRALAANVPPPLKNFYCGRLEEPDADECARLDDWIVHCVGKPKATELASLGIETVEHLNNKTKLLDGVGVRYNDKTQVLSVC